MPRCKTCKDKFEVKYFNQKYCMEKDPCIKAFTEYARALQKKKEAKEWQKEKKVLRERLETKSDCEKKLQKEINLIARIIDRGYDCISSGRPLGMDERTYHGGHFLSVGSNPQVRFHLFNIFGQSIEQNKNKGGNPLGYMEGLEKAFGSDLKDFCISLKGLPPMNLEKHQIKDKISIARGIVKWLKLQDRKFTPKERIELRLRFNEELGIYKN